jgi:hypothetical protein
MTKAILAITLIGFAIGCDDFEDGDYFRGFDDGYAQARDDDFACVSRCNDITETCDGFEACVRDCF